MVDHPTNKLNRRTVLQGVGYAAVVNTVPVSEPANAYSPGPDETRARYRETDHVKAFYRTNGYETLKK